LASDAHQRHQTDDEQSQLKSLTTTMTTKSLQAIAAERNCQPNQLQHTDSSADVLDGLHLDVYLNELMCTFNAAHTHSEMCAHQTQHKTAAAAADVDIQ
jgi:hypothetical protein